MTTVPDAISVEVWAPIPEQLAVLQDYALGYRWWTAAKRHNVPNTTFARWLREERFRELGAQMRNEVTYTALPMYGAIIEKAQSVLLRVKTDDDDGDLDPQDPLVIWAFTVLRSTLWPVLLARGVASTGIEPRDALRISDGS